jgi:hypothetical protein
MTSSAASSRSQLRLGDRTEGIAVSPEEKIDQRENGHRSDNYDHRRPSAGSSDVLSSKAIFVRGGIVLLFGHAAASDDAVAGR